MVCKKGKASLSRGKKGRTALSEQLAQSIRNQQEPTTLVGSQYILIDNNLRKGNKPATQRKAGPKIKSREIPPCLSQNPPPSNPEHLFPIPIPPSSNNHHDFHNHPHSPLQIPARNHLVRLRSPLRNLPGPANQMSAPGHGETVHAQHADGEEPLLGAL